METEYKSQNIDQFFNQFKVLSKAYKFEKVHQLIQNPDAKATHAVLKNNKPLKFIIMTSVILIGLSILFFWTRTDKPGMNNPTESFENSFNPIAPIVDSTVISTTKKVNNSEINHDTNNESTFNIANNESANDFVGLFEEHGFDFSVSEDEHGCDWPEDTVIDRHELFVYLNKEEVAKLGVLLTDSSMYYVNKLKLSNGKSKSIGYKYNWVDDTDYHTENKFYFDYTSDIACTKYRWGHRFYREIDTLVPVVITLDNELMILWFNPHKTLFENLPKRYKHLESTYHSLRCLKNKNPDKQYTNFWDEKRNIILDVINYLVLDNEELENIGVEIFKDSIYMIDPTGTFRYELTKWGNSIGTWAQDSIPVPDIPSMFPTLLTDVKGLKQCTWGKWMENKEKERSMEVFNILVPILFPVSDLISNKDYQLILWYYPTGEFLDALPDRYRNSIKAEIDYISSGIVSEDANCNYFEVCKSTLQLDDFKAYPNPAKSSITVEFSSDMVMIGTISIVNIAGVKLKEVLPTTTFLAGENSFQLDVSGVSPGIYLISINTDKGFKTQRLIVTD